MGGGWEYQGSGVGSRKVKFQLETDFRWKLDVESSVGGSNDIIRSMRICSVFFTVRCQFGMMHCFMVEILFWFPVIFCFVSLPKFVSAYRPGEVIAVRLLL